MTRRYARTDIAASVLAEMAPWSDAAEDAAVTAWRGLDAFTSLSAEQLRQERRALLEMQDMIERAVKATTGEPATVRL